MSKREQEIVSAVLEDFKKRQEARRPVELNWRLNMNFVIGNQFSEISPRGDVEEYGRQYFWQCREVYNHIAPILETRLSKLARVKAQASVRPSSPDDADRASAEVATKLIRAVSADNGFSALMSEANVWSEVTGSAFYKVTWDTQKGMALTADGTLREGDVKITVCPPFEIFPENIAVAELDAQPSLMHVKVMGVGDVFRIWGKRVEGRTLNVFSFENADVLGGLGYHATVPKMVTEAREDAALVIEKYEMPSESHPEGRLIIVAGETLVHDGPLPYINGEDGTRGYPFAKQVCLESLGNFFGGSVVERIIPVQRAYNAVKNRKHEFMNRIAMGVLAVEDGSVDTEELIEEAREDRDESRRFLDIFNQALYILYYRAFNAYKLGQRTLEEGDKDLALLQRALLGFGLSGLEKEAGAGYADLSCIPIFLRHTRSAHGLALTLKTLLGTGSYDIEQCLPNIIFA